MTCWTPTLIKNPDKTSLERYITVPCGYCGPCRKRRAQQWSFRLMQHKKNAVSSFFITLTYSDDNLVYSGNYPTLCLRDWQNYWKRVRKANPCKFEYYGCGEYGERSGRPHYHAIVFASAIPDVDTFARHWPFGHTDVGKVTMQSVSYVTGYMMKVSPVKELEKAGEIEKSRAFMSKGLGKEYLSTAVVNYHKKGEKVYCTIDGGQKVSMPRYYKERIWTQEEEMRKLKIRLKKASKQKAQEMLNEFMKRYPNQDLDKIRFNQIKYAIDREGKRASLRRNKV